MDPSPLPPVIQPTPDPTPVEQKTSVVPQLTVSILIAIIYAGAHWATWKLGLDTVFAGLITTDSTLMVLLANYWMGSSYGSDKKTTAMLGVVNKKAPTPPIPAA